MVTGKLTSTRTWVSDRDSPNSASDVAGLVIHLTIVQPEIKNVFIVIDMESCRTLEDEFK